LTRGELAFYRILRLAIPRYTALSLKTRLVDVVGCPDELWTTPYGRRLAQKHVDFVLFDQDTAAIIAVLELDDRSHRLPSRRLRDLFVDDVFARSGVPLIRVRAASRYDLLDLRRCLAKYARHGASTKQHAPLR
jgi:hypothetical protein